MFVTTYLVGELLLGLVEPEVLLLKRLVLILALLDDLPLASVYSSCRLLSPTSRSSGVEGDFSCCFLLLGLFLFLYLKAKSDVETFDSKSRLIILKLQWFLTCSRIYSSCCP